MGTTWALVRFYWGYGALVGLLWAVCRMAVGKVKSHENSTVSRNRAIGIDWNPPRVREGIYSSNPTLQGQGPPSALHRVRLLPNDGPGLLPGLV